MNRDPAGAGFEANGETVSAFLDANVLWGLNSTDLLMRLGQAGLIQPRWSPDVLGEVARTVRRSKPQVDIDRRIRAMTTAMPDAMVTGYEALIPFMPAEQGDQHVLAAAVHSSANVLVTNNLKHFHPGRVGLRILVMDTNDFARALLARAPHTVVRALDTMVRAYKRPPKTLTEFVEQAGVRAELGPFARDLNRVLPVHLRSQAQELEAPVSSLSPAAQVLAGWRSGKGVRPADSQGRRRPPDTKPSAGIER